MKRKKKGKELPKAGKKEWYMNSFNGECYIYPPNWPKNPDYLYASSWKIAEEVRRLLNSKI